MKKFLLLLICCIAVFSFAVCPAGASENMYFTARAGVTLPEDSSVNFDENLEAEFEYDTGFSLAAAIGGQVNRNLRVEPEISYQKNDLDSASDSEGSVSVDGDASLWAFMFNSYYDFTPDAAVTPYIGAGIGFARVEVSDITSPAFSGYYLKGDKDSVFCYQGSVGLAWEVGNDMTMDLSYRYFATEDPDFAISETEFASHNFYAGLRVPF